MKTLDEVINGMEHCHEDNCMECPYQFEPKDFDCITQCQYTDALHYLKEFKRISARLEKIALGNITETLEKLDNPALSWDELKAMEGKPVWVELPHSYRKAWGLNDGMFTDAYGNDCITVKVLHDLWHLQKKQMGEAWQAYRKERG